MRSVPLRDAWGVTTNRTPYQIVGTYARTPRIAPTTRSNLAATARKQAGCERPENQSWIEEQIPNRVETELRTGFPPARPEGSCHRSGCVQAQARPRPLAWRPEQNRREVGLRRRREAKGLRNSETGADFGAERRDGLDASRDFPAIVVFCDDFPGAGSNLRKAGECTTMRHFRAPVRSA
jgi:hypothetical protein